MVAYRTYPHVDMAETGARAAQILMRLGEERGRSLKRVVRRIPFLIPVNGMCTLAEPARGTYERLAALERDAVVSLSFTPGFPASDFPECGAAVWGYGFDEAAVTAAVEALASASSRRSVTGKCASLTRMPPCAKPCGLPNMPGSPSSSPTRRTTRGWAAIRTRWASCAHCCVTARATPP
jgi:microcystin degradation protein MlrC